MVFQGENVSLIEDVIKKERAFFPTFQEWLADGNMEQVVKHVASAGNTTIYSVPFNHTFFITACSITIRCTSGAPAQRTASIAMPDGNLLISASIVGGNTASNNSNSFTMPLQVASGNITSSISANSFGIYSIQGFLLPKKISIR